MKYSIETIEGGFIETLEVNGKEYTKRWEEVDFCHFKCQDDEFYEQLERDGFDNKQFLDKVYEDIDENNLIYDFTEIQKGIEWGVL